MRGDSTQTCCVPPYMNAETTGSSAPDGGHGMILEVISKVHGNTSDPVGLRLCPHEHDFHIRSDREVTA
jgi:hypothetical protein